MWNSRPERHKVYVKRFQTLLNARSSRTVHNIEDGDRGFTDFVSLYQDGTKWLIWRVATIPLPAQSPILLPIDIQSFV